MKILGPIGNVLGSLCLGAALVLSLPGIQAVRAGEPAAAETPASSVVAVPHPVAPAEPSEAGVCEPGAAGPASRAEAVLPAPSRAREGAAPAEVVVLNNAGYNY